jgi:hypothetical protein
MPEADRRLREVAQLRKVWRAFRGPQERLEDERLAGPILRARRSSARLRESTPCYGQPAVLAAIRVWWCARDYAAIVALAEWLDLPHFDDEPLIRVYVDAAKALLTEPDTP